MAKPAVHDGNITGQVVYKDVYGNLVSNIPAAALPEDKRRMVFYDVVYYQDIGVGSRKAYEVVAVKYGLPLITVNKIVIEGATKQWPMPPR